MIEFKHGDCLDLIKYIKSESVDCILTDPPYKYLKNQKLEVDFDEVKFFNESKRILRNDGFIVLFGRGTSFYRWNTMLADLDFEFKEEFIWDKSYCTSPLLAVSRIHETIAIHTKRDGIINRVKVPYLEMKSNDLESIISDIKRLRTVFSNAKSLDAVQKFLESNTRTDFERSQTFYKHSVTGNINSAGDGDRCVKVINSIEYGMNEKTIIRHDFEASDKLKGQGFFGDRRTGDRSVNVVNALENGMNEKTIIQIARDHYATIHPTQKPVRLIERLLELTTKEGDLVVDPFAGSFVTGEACYNTDRDCILMEIDQEYFDNGSARMKSVMRVPKQKQLSFIE